ncbi:tyrosinase-like protein [Dreissena polymorpha]|uniref:Tyrosinase copper-binding domain-containing protein n=1 Tax=Dreissena polymorpha TaxID=45954 RepID=A0A9D4HLS1_DREPO|nr:tyrosinase-like protein [Dreissena polymorpha]KAH3722178.1 hypothetical protein DPMN_065132 [Dreissena polymorpha]
MVLCVFVIRYATPLENVLPPQLADCVNRLSSLASTTPPKASGSVVDINVLKDANQSAAEQIAIDNAGTVIPILNTPENVYLYCIWQFFTKTDVDLANGLIEFMVSQTDMKHLRNKPQYNHPRPNDYPRDWFPQTGFRIRREYRQLSNGERNAFHTVLRTMKTNGVYDMFAELHKGIVTTSAHGGPNFLGWHRVYLALFEEAMRRIDPSVSIPYWDSTLDMDMAKPENTVVFSSEFLGNGRGHVTTGPFANWVTPVGPLTRNIAANSSVLFTLFTKENIRMIMTRCQTRDITSPTALPEFDLDHLHGGPHRWVGGQMSGLNTAAHDPAFLLHHAFVDYIWEMFRNHQIQDCGVNPSFNYPEATGQHAPERPMDGLPGYVNIDGYQSYWTQNWYRYKRAPKCPNCGSPYLTCHPVRKVCISIERKLTPHELPSLRLGSTESLQDEARAEVEMLNIGATF